MTYARDVGSDDRATHRVSPRPLSGGASAHAAVLRLQRSIGNRGVRALLRDSPKTTPPRGEFPTLPSLSAGGGLDAKAWSDKVAALKTAIAKRDPDQAKKLYIDLFRDLATTLGADIVPDIPDTFPINVVEGAAPYMPGLNVVFRSGEPGATAYIDAGGKWGVPLDFAAGAPEPHIAIRLDSSSFVADKAMALAWLRHELAHARHLEHALGALRNWRKAGGKGTESAFESWLSGHRKGLSDVDIALIKSSAKGELANTEALAYVEGFMAVFHLIEPAPPPSHLIFLELLGVLSTTKTLPWKRANSAVQDELVKRLERYYCELLDAGHRRAFDDWVQEQVKKARDDEAALKAKSGAGARADVIHRQEEGFSGFIGKLAAIPAKCAPRKPAAHATSGAAAPSTGAASGEEFADMAARYGALLAAGRPGDDAFVESKLRSLDKDTLAKLEDATAKLPKDAAAALRRKISFVRHAPPDAVRGIDELTISGGTSELTDGKRKLASQDVDGGAVAVTSDSNLTWSESYQTTLKTKMQHAVTFQYHGKLAPRTHWLQFIWRQIVVTDARGGETVLDKTNTNSAGISYRLTPKGSKPIIAVDRATASEPWYERNSPSHRDPSSINVADVPAPDDGLFNEFLTGPSPARGVVSSVHLVTYLVRDDKVLFQVTTDATYTWSRKPPGEPGDPYRVTGPVYKVKATPARALAPRDREALVRDFPDLDYIP